MPRTPIALAAQVKVALYKGYIRSLITYAAPTWYALSSTSQKKKIQAQQNIAQRMIVSVGGYVLNEVIARDFHIEAVEEFIQYINITNEGNYEFLRNIAPMHERSPSGRLLPRELLKSSSPTQG
ncbi:hypothetical protein EVAR_19481_1 [Eumeta japonica]|uniref:Uncharacterized protein n=1 Tax=Eumeta variegata TaxID=151549 RepID=A0A4C1V9M0_EUMVA|nr:hypothetical protein EVAR_19481_1 [Eumeta japonica]